MENQLLRFQPFVSDCEPSFWAQYGKNKLDLYRLADEIHHFCASYSTSTTQAPRAILSAEFSFASPFDDTSLPSLGPMSSLLCVAMKNFNTLDEFKDANKQQMLSAEGEQLYSDIVSGAVLTRPSLLARAFLLSYVDLKKHSYLHWFAFPSFNVSFAEFHTSPSISISSLFSYSQTTSLISSFQSFSRDSGDASSMPDMTMKGFFTIFVSSSGSVDVRPFSAITEFENLPLSSSESSSSSASSGYQMLGFLDPSGADEPSWPLRNALYALMVHAKGVNRVRVLCFRDPKILLTSVSSSISESEPYHWKSFVLDVEIKPSASASASTDSSISQPLSFGSQFCEKMPPVVGWERNNKGKLLPRQTNLSSFLDARKVMDAAVDLNLKLMRWRVLPNLDLSKIQNTKVLLVGSGTLGCNVARGLLAWGIKHFTFIDNGRVSYSNPVRQSLFTFDDCAEGGKYKAHAAAQALKKIYPGVTTKGYVMSVPMPGHEASTPQMVRFMFCSSRFCDFAPYLRFMYALSI